MQSRFGEGNGCEAKSEDAHVSDVAAVGTSGEGANFYWKFSGNEKNNDSLVVDMVTTAVIKQLLLITFG